MPIFRSAAAILVAGLLVSPNMANASLEEAVLAICEGSAPGCFHQVKEMATERSTDAEVADASLGESRQRMNRVRARIAFGCKEAQPEGLLDCVAKLLKEEAAKNKPEAQIILGYWLMNYSKKPEDARKMFAAASSRLPLAALFLGQLYESGEGGSKDLAAAQRLYLQAAESGDAEAQYTLGEFFLYGRKDAVRPDFAKAKEWLTKAARSGSADAQALLAREFDSGKRFDRSPKEAIDWYEQAALAGHSEALLNLGVIYLKGDLGLQRDTARGVRLIELAANAGEREAMSFLADIYLQGYGVIPNNAKGREWMEKAARLGDKDAGSRLVKSGMGYGRAIDFWNATAPQKKK